MRTTLRIVCVLGFICASAGLVRAEDCHIQFGPRPLFVLGARETPTSEESASEIHFAIPRHRLTVLERETVATCLVLEAANQGEQGLRAVMGVIRNRAHNDTALFAPCVLRTRQFTAMNAATTGQTSLWRLTQMAKRDRTWRMALSIVTEATSDDWTDLTRGATHYTRTGERTPWARRLQRVAVIGNHSFFQ